MFRLHAPILACLIPFFAAAWGQESTAEIDGRSVAVLPAFVPIDDPTHRGIANFMNAELGRQLAHNQRHSAGARTHHAALREFVPISGCYRRGGRREDPGQGKCSTRFAGNDDLDRCT